ncbi:MAG: phage terminase large subunit [Sodalis sp. (in: enterobacteria)]|uniref:phage terminase large subunit n=1 Tax=Sodalis sp. (in: enterobacteria) TaxID=1898979 RepID=UPI003F2F77C8
MGAQIHKQLPDTIISNIIALQEECHCLWSGVLRRCSSRSSCARTELIKRAAQLGHPVPARAIIPHADKLLRIETLQPHMKNGLIRLHASHTTLIQQLRHFPRADHDDGPDALHMLWTLAVTHGPKTEYRSLSGDRHPGRLGFSCGGW